MPLLSIPLLAIRPGFQWSEALVSLATALFMVVLVLRVFRSAPKRALEGKDARELDLTYELDVAGYSVRSAASSTRAQWSTVQRWEEGPSAFLLYVGSVPQVVPKRAFREADVARVRALLEERVDGAL